MGVSLSLKQAEQFHQYHNVLLEAGRTMNLTRVPEDEREAIDRNYLDSLAPLGESALFLDVRSLIDVGAGAGLPGVPLAIALPDVRVTMLDSLGKRVNFLQSVIEKLCLNARAIHARCEDAARLPELRDAFDMAVARAVADTAQLLELALPFVRPGGRLLCYKGPALDEELPRARRAISELNGQIEKVIPMPIPGRDWDHRLLVIKKTAPTPSRYPRKAGVPGRKPL